MGAHRIKDGVFEDAAARGILDGIRRIVQVLRVGSRDAEKRVGLSAAQLFVLHKLADAGADGRPLSLNELADRTLTHQSSVSVVVQRLVERGWVARDRSRTDARRVELSLTPGGRRIIRNAPEAAQERLIGALVRMSRPAREALARSLGQLIRETGLDVAGDTPMLFEESSTPGARRTGRSLRKSPKNAGRA